MTATSFVRSPRTCSTAETGNSPVWRSKSATRTVAPAAPGGQPPRPHVGVVIQRRDDNLVPRPPRPRQRVGQMERQRGHVRPQDHALGHAADQVGDRRPGGRDDFGAASTGGESPVDVGHGRAERVGDRVDDRDGNLCAGRAVQRGVIGRKPGKLSSQVVDREKRGRRRCVSAHGGQHACRGALTQARPAEEADKCQRSQATVACRADRRSRRSGA